MVQKSTDFADKQSYRSADKVEKGVQKSENFADVLNGSPLSYSHAPSSTLDVAERMNVMHLLYLSVSSIQDSFVRLE